MIAMIRKELRAIAPFLLGVLLVISIEVIEAALRTYSPTRFVDPEVDGVSSWLLVSGLLVFAIGQSIVGRDFIDGQIEFLDGLPISRTTIFAAKIVTGALVPTVLTLSTIGIEVLAFAALDNGLSLSVGELVALQGRAYTAGIFAFFATGLLFAWFADLGWGLLFVGMMMLGLVAELMSDVRPLSLFSGFGSVDFIHSTPRSSAFAERFWWTWAAGCVLLSWVAFLGPGEVFLRTGSKVLARVRRVVGFGLLGLVVLFASCSSLTQLDALRARLFPDSRFVRTAHFDILYDAAHADTTLPLVEAAEDIDARVRRAMHTELEVRLEIEVFELPQAFHAGEQSGGKVRVAPNDASQLTLAHELAHAYAEVISGAGGRKNAEVWRFFNEGLATWIAARALDDPGSLDEMHAWAGAIFHAEHHGFDLLVDDRERRKRFDPFEVYPLGLALVETVVDRYGPEAPTCLLSRLAQLEADDAAPIALWYAMFNGCGYVLDETLDDYEERLARYAGEDEFPRAELVGRVRGSGATLRLVVSDEARSGAPLVCRFRRGPDSDLAEMGQVFVGPNGTCAVDDRGKGSVSFEYQLGYRIGPTAVMFGPWVEERLR